MHRRVLEHRLAAAPAPRRAAPGPRRGASKRPPVAGDVAERQVGGLARARSRARCRRARPASRRPRSVSTASATDAAVADARDPVGERRGVAQERRTRPGRSAAAPPARARPAVAGPCAAAAIGAIAGGVDAELRRHPAGEGAELHLAEPRQQRRPASGSRTSSASSGSSSGTSRRSVTRSREMRICSAWPSSTSRRFGCLISPARASSVSRSPYSLDQLRRGLDADAGRAGHVVDRVAGQRLHVDHPVGADAELLEHLVGADRACSSGCRTSRCRGRRAASGPCRPRRSSPARRPPRPASRRWR